MKKHKDWLTVSNVKPGSAADVYIYDEIGDWGTTAKDFAQIISELDVKTLNLHINSPGGSVFDGMAIMNALRRHKARVEVSIDGLAASAASYIAMAGDHIVMNRGAELMIHDASGGAWGPASTMFEMGETLEKISNSIADVYAARAGKTRADWRELMLAETWFTAEEAVLAGLADEWVDAPVAAASFDFKNFRYQGRVAAPAPGVSVPVLGAVNKNPAAVPGNTRKGDLMNFEDFKAGLRERLGVKTNVRDEELLAAVDAVVNKEPVKAEIPEGTQLVDSALLEQLKADAQTGLAAMAEIVKARRDGIVAAAVKEGRIAPAAAEAWRAQLDVDEEGAKALLDSLAVNVVPVTEIGHSDDVKTAEDALYDKAFGIENSRED